MVIAFRNRLAILGSAGFLVLACTVTSTTNAPDTTDAGTSSGDGGKSDTGSSGSSGSSGDSGGTDASSCKVTSITFGAAACDACVESSCCDAVNACFTVKDCQDLDKCIEDCVTADAGPSEGGADAGDPVKQCVQDCAAAHPSSASAWQKALSCVVQSCRTPCGF